jgi:hypothetical protein
MPSYRLVGFQAKRPSPISSESDQRRARSLASSAVINTDLINVQIGVAWIEFVFGAIHDRAVDAADNCAVYFRYPTRVANTCFAVYAHRLTAMTTNAVPRARERRKIVLRSDGRALPTSRWPSAAPHGNAMSPRPISGALSSVPPGPILRAP